MDPDTSKIEEVSQEFSEIVSRKLPSVGALISQGFAFLKSRPDFLLALVASSSVLALLDTVPESAFGSGGEHISVYIGLGILMIVASISYLITSTAILHTVVESPHRTVSLKDSIVWAYHNVWSVLWIYVLLFLVLWGGFILFLIPGIIVMLSVYFALYVYIKEGLKGMSALERSRDLVRGNWWNLASKISLFWIVLVVALAVVGSLVFMLLKLVVTNVLAFEFVWLLIMQVIGVALSIMSLHMGMDLYKSLSSENSPAGKSSPKWQYLSLVVIAVLSFVLVVASVVIADEENEQVTTESIDTKSRAVQLRGESGLD